MANKRKQLAAIPRNYPHSSWAKRRAWLFRSQDGRCFYCGVDMRLCRSPRLPDDCTIEHLMPRAMGGTNAPENLVAACVFCNSVAQRIETWIWKTFLPTYGRKAHRAA